MNPADVLTPDGRGALMVLAAQSVIGDGAALGALSPVARITLNTIRVVTEDVLKEPIEKLSRTLISELSEQIGNIATSLGLEMMDVIPYLGTIIKAIASLISLIASAKAAQEAELQEYCSLFLDRYKLPAGTGSSLAGCVLCPTDLFAANIAPESWRGGAPKLRCALAQVLMRITEGSPMDVDDLNWNQAAVDLAKAARDDSNLTPKPANVLRAEWITMTDQRFADMATVYPIIAIREGLSYHPGLGMPKARTAQLRALRKAMEACYGPSLPAGAVSDGGVALWPVYLDLFLDCFTKGWLNWDYCAYLLRCDITGSDGNAHVSETGWFGPSDSPECNQRIVGLVRGLVTQWKQSVQPYYSQGKAKMLELEQEASKIVGMKVGTQPRIKMNFGPAASKFQPAIAPLLLVAGARAAKEQAPIPLRTKILAGLSAGALVVGTVGILRNRREIKPS